MVDPRDKGARAETLIRDKLRDLTKLKWERVPGSGALDPKHKLKGDLYIPEANNIFCVECKHYAEDHLTSKILTSANPQFLEWWTQAQRQANQVGKKPLLIFKFDRSKIMVAYTDLPSSAGNLNVITIEVGDVIVFVSLLEDWIKKEAPKFIWQ